MALTKIVNGIEYKLSPSEAVKVRKRWAREEAKQQAYIKNEKYKDDRRDAYPDIGDQLDAILKQLNFMQMDGQTDLITEMDGLISQWLKVKRDIPKPDGV